MISHEGHEILAMQAEGLGLFHGLNGGGAGLAVEEGELSERSPVVRMARISSSPEEDGMVTFTRPRTMM
jgi:hypothetical protein